jgi:hypothetical protein
MKIWAGLVLVAALTALAPRPAPAAELHFVIDDHNPEASLPDEQQREAHPRALHQLVRELTARGEAATQHGDHLAAARYYSALAQVMPDRSLAYARLCHALDILGEREGAIDACADALARDGVTIDDFMHYVRLILGKASLGPVDRRNVDTQIAFLEGLPGGGPSAAQLRCELGTRVGDAALRGWCPSSAATDPVSRSYQWLLGAAGEPRWNESMVRLLVLVAIAGAAIFLVLRRLLGTST